MRPKTTKFYVYALYDSSGFPFYIGKGCGRRVKHHFKPSLLKSNSHKNNKIKHLLKTQGFVKFEILVDNLSEQQAYETEKFLIKSYGLISEGGCLTNVLKSNSDYVESALKKGRTNSLVTNSKINKQVAEEMIRLKSENPKLTFEELGKLFSVSGARVCDLFNNKMKTIDLQINHTPKKLRTLNNDVVLSIKADKDNKVPVKLILKKYKISKTHFYRIINDKLVYLKE